jgi:glycine cleavage system aminomethyltransferase T
MMEHKPNYASSHETRTISAKRFEISPYDKHFATPETVWGVYAQRFYPLTSGEDATEHYWKLRRSALLFDVPEKPIEIIGPDAIPYLEHLFTRKISDLKDWRARYAIACNPDGGILMDGVLMRLAKDHFIYVQADGEFMPWMAAQATGFDVRVSDPKSWVLQVQGPKALDILAQAAENIPGKFGYFHVAKAYFAGQELLTSRTGWTGEMGFEIYGRPDIDADALWHHLLDKGKEFDLTFCSLETMGIRRMEAGILDNGTDMDPNMTPFQAGLGVFVDLSKGNFVGKKALAEANTDCRLFGLKCQDAIPFAGLDVYNGTDHVAKMRAGAWSPYLDTGIGYVHFNKAGNWLGRELTLKARDGSNQSCKIVSLPFYDEEKLIPRGKPHRFSPDS